ncbi:T-cell receptor gamma alternate reading frame protein isoform X4 [Loxodonta africana]|nr:TCR gamma alternate reading frame protein isoform X5 [Loxodonta africana]
MLWSPALLLAFLALASQKASSLDMRKISVTKQRGTSVVITCDLDLNVNYIHWYRYREGEALQRLLYYYIPTSAVTMDSGFNSRKYHASGNTATNCKVELKNLEESDSGVYYCAAWDYDRKLFGGGTKLIVTDKNLDADLSPKPTIFLPSVAERIQHKAGTYLCLLEKFFPDVIKVDWKEKNSERILESQQGDTIKTGDTFMKFSWLTVTEKSWDKEHQCVVKHENIKEADEMILFPSIKRGCALANSAKEETNRTTSAAAAHEHLCVLYLPPPPSQERLLLGHCRILSAQKNRSLWQRKEFIADGGTKGPSFLHLLLFLKLSAQNLAGFSF